MAETAAHLVGRVLLEVPIRQWVLTLPYPLRYRCAYDARLTSEVLRAFIRSLFAEFRRRARRQWGTPAELCGAVTFYGDRRLCGGGGADSAQAHPADGLVPPGRRPDRQDDRVRHRPHRRLLRRQMAAERIYWDQATVLRHTRQL
jgi:hypothetical protein